MEIQQFFEQVVIQIGSASITYGQLIVAIFAFGGLGIIYRSVSTSTFQKLLGTPITDKAIAKIRRNITYIFVALGIWAIIALFDLDVTLFANDNLTIKVSTLLLGVIILLCARFFDWVISKVIIKNAYTTRDIEKKPSYGPGASSDKEAGRIVQWLVYIVAILIILNGFKVDYTLFSFEQEDGEYNFKISIIFRTILIFVIARLVVWLLIQIVLYGYYHQKHVNIGSQFAINQLLKYVIYFIAAMYALETLGIQMTLLWGGAAALLVGVGLGLQQTFNDFISGLILLFERSLEVGDVLEINGMVGTVKKIGLRASLIEVRDNTTVIVPNSKLVVDSIVNWSHYYAMARFDITVGVAYGSDTQLVKKLLIQSTEEESHILDYPSPFVRFIDFADSSLTFRLFFFSKDFITIEDIKSNLRFNIDELFREHNIKIPFPQREVWDAHRDI